MDDRAIVDNLGRVNDRSEKRREAAASKYATGAAPDRITAMNFLPESRSTNTRFPGVERTLCDRFSPLVHGRTARCVSSSA